jgi:hypothetical protein
LIHSRVPLLVGFSSDAMDAAFPLTHFLYLRLLQKTDAAPLHRREAIAITW